MPTAASPNRSQNAPMHDDGELTEDQDEAVVSESGDGMSSRLDNGHKVHEEVSAFNNQQKMSLAYASNGNPSQAHHFNQFRRR